MILPQEPWVLVVCVGDVMLDVLVEAPRGLVPDDDTAATITFEAGGQAANVAAWVVALGGSARVFGPQAGNGRGRLVADALAARGVSLHGPTVTRPGAVVSVVADGSRSLASDPGDSAWLTSVSAGPWLHGADWLLVSGYALLRSPAPQALVDLAGSARNRGTRVAVDLSSAALIEEYGAAAFRALWRSLAPAVVFASDAEWAAAGGGFDGTLVLKHGAAGASFGDDHRTPVAGPVLDATGAGDALAAGYLVGGPDLAMATAARCLARVGAQP
ncbi:MAG: carbohydrate kinase family protein [Nocardioidaceae bacterium]